MFDYRFFPVRSYGKRSIIREHPVYRSFSICLNDRSIDRSQSTVQRLPVAGTEFTGVSAARRVCCSYGNELEPPRILCDSCPELVFRSGVRPPSPRKQKPPNSPLKGFAVRWLLEREESRCSRLAVTKSELRPNNGLPRSSPTAER